MTDGKKTVLVVEDDEQSQKYMRILLGRDFDVLIAGNGPEVIQTLDRHAVDLILMDLSLRDGEDGLQITRKIRAQEKTAHIPVIALTAHAFPEDRKQSLAAGCNEYVSKPFQWSDLHTIMDRLMMKQPDNEYS